MLSKHEIAFELARRRLIQFSILTNKKYMPSWHHRVLAHELEELVTGNNDRLIVTMPPRHGKSELVSVRFPAFFLGHNPHNRVISTSYSYPLARKFSRQVRQIALSDTFRTLFPACQIKPDVRSVDMWETVTDGGLISSGVGGAITGFGGDLINIDDPFKNSEQADSAVYREKVKEWYQSTLMTRLEKGGRIVVTMTRWHESDLVGWLLDEMLNGGDQWRTVNFPAIAEENEQYRQIGDPLWAEKYDLKDLERRKTAVGSRVWNALYQQRPAPSDGTIFHREWWQFYDVLPAGLRMYQSWDMTFKDSTGSDFVVGQVWGTDGVSYYLIDQIRERMDFTQTVKAFKALSSQYPEATAKYIEDKANGPAVISALKGSVQGLIPVTPKSSKTARAYAIQPILEAGNVFLRRGAKFTHELIEEAAYFPAGKHDDMVDALTQAISQGAKRAVPAAASTGQRQANKFLNYVNKTELSRY